MKKPMVLLSVLGLGLAGCGKEASSIGIIGGADGPTAIFVTSNTNWFPICGLIVAIIVIGFIIYRKKK